MDNKTINNPTKNDIIKKFYKDSKIPILFDDGENGYFDFDDCFLHKTNPNSLDGTPTKTILPCRAAKIDNRIRPLGYYTTTDPTFTYDREQPTPELIKTNIENPNSTYTKLKFYNNTLYIKKDNTSLEYFDNDIFVFLFENIGKNKYKK